MTVALIVDSAAALPPAITSDLAITVVPLHLTVGGEEHRDGDLALDDLVARLDEGVTTSAPSPGEYAQAIAARLDDGYDGAVVLTVSSEMSTSFQSARLAAQQFDATDVRIVDTRTAAGGEALVAIAAAGAATDGADVDDVEALARKLAGQVRLVATVPSLDRLVASGRVPAVAGWVGGQLGVNPLFEFRTGEVHRLRPAFSRDAALRRIAEMCAASRPPGARCLHAAVMHALAPDAADELGGAVAAHDDHDHDCFVGSFSPVMVSHTGPGLAGVAWWWET